MTRGFQLAERLAQRLKRGNMADIMRRIEERLEVFRKSDFAGCGELLRKAPEICDRRMACDEEGA